MPLPTVRKTVQFYVTDLLTNEGKSEADQSTPFRALLKYPVLPNGDGPCRYRKFEDDLDICLHPIKRIRPRTFVGRLHYTKKNDPPLLGHFEDERPVEFKDKNEGIRTPTHFVWWDLSDTKDRKGIPAIPVGLLGLEFNVAGPRHTTFEHYINSFINQDHGHFRVVPIFDGEAYREVKANPIVTSVAVRVDGDNPDAKAWLTKLAGVDQMSNVGVIEYEVRAKRGKKMDVGPAFTRMEDLAAQQWIDQIAMIMPNGTQVILGDSKVVQVVRPFVRADSQRYVESSSMFQEIRHAASRVRDQLERVLHRELPDLEDTQGHGGSA